MKPYDLVKIGCLATVMLTSVTPAIGQDKANRDASVSFVEAQSNSEMRAAKWIGATVQNGAGETVGDINDLILDKDLKVITVVVGVGGFLGIAEKNVAVSADKVKMSVTKDNARVAIVNASKDVLANAPDYKYAHDKTLRERLGEISDAAAQTYGDTKKAVKEGYDETKKAVTDAMSDDTTTDKADPKQ